MTTTITTQVGIVGAGPAGLMLSHLLDRAGIESVVLEARDRDYVEARVRAGVLEAGTVALMEAIGVSDRLHREGLVHGGVYLQFGAERHHIDFKELTGKTITVYGQQEVVKDLIAARVAAGGPLVFEVSDVTYEGIDTASPVIRYHHQGDEVELRCDVIAGCDGFWGISRGYLASGGVRTFDRTYPFAWLGILARVAPSVDELVYAFNERGFAMHSLRSPEISRLYIQVDPDEDLDAWPDDRIWSELQIRLAYEGWTLEEGPVIEKGITPMRSFVSEPMRAGRLFLAGDAAHIVPPTGAKGLNLAVADVAFLADALVSWYAKNDETGLDHYGDRCASRVWRVQDFSTMMTTLLHLDANADEFDQRLQQARQAEIIRSSALSANLAENYVGLPLHTSLA
jgi:p-hydroxybenzoate 3-monooxygenase